CPKVQQSRRIVARCKVTGVENQFYNSGRWKKARLSNTPLRPPKFCSKNLDPSKHFPSFFIPNAILKHSRRAKIYFLFWSFAFPFHLYFQPTQRHHHRLISNCAFLPLA